MRKIYTTLMILVLISSLAGVGMAQVQPKPTSLLQYGQANVVGQRTAPTVNPNLVQLIDQAPNGFNGIFVDSSCDYCGTGQQTVGDNFVLSTAQTIEQIVFWTGYFPSDVPLATDTLTVIFHQDNGGVPGATVATESNVPYMREQTGVVLFGVHEWVHTLTLATPVTLGPGTFWLEIFNNTGFTGTDFFWETGNLDPVNGGYDAAFAFETPGVSWYAPLGYDMSLQLWGSGEATEPDIEVTPAFLTADQAPDTVTSQVLTILNNGTAELKWELSEQVVLGTLAGSMPFKPVNVKSTGTIDGSLTVSSPAGALGKPEAPANPQAVLWNQPLSSVNQNAYVNQQFGDFADFSSYLADDFVNAEPWNVSSIFVPGDLWNGGSSLLNATSLTWQIYADNGGKPAGDPSGVGAPPVWTFTLAPTDPQVALSLGTPGGYLSNTTLNLSAPVTVPAGHWWLVFFPTMDFGAGGQFGRQPADTANGFVAQFINPLGGFGYGTAWQNWTVLGVAQTDIAFRLEGEVGPEPGIPWLSEDLLTGVVPAGGFQDINVTFDSTGLAPGTYTGNLLVDSNDPDEPQVVVPVTLNVLAGGDTLHLNATRSYGWLGAGRVKWIQLVRIYDQSMLPVEGVKVFGEWTYPDGRVLPVEGLRLTNLLGDTKFQLKAAKPGAYQFCVVNMELAGYTYDPMQNEVDPCFTFVTP